MTAELDLRAALAHKAAAERFFADGNAGAARQEIARLEALEFSFLSVTDTPDYAPRRVTVCIVAYRRSADTALLLASIGALSRDEAFSFCLVSNAGEDLFDQCEIPAATRRIVTGANLGASLGRNAAIHGCGSEYMIFVDDDGFTGPDNIRALLATAQGHDAVAVRGRVISRGDFLNMPPHYDLGDFRVQSMMNIEGMTLWRTDALKLEWFDPLLYGHEGVDLTARLYPFYGPDAFLYDPDAILLHDFAASGDKRAEKMARMKKNDAYLAQVNPNLAPVKKAFYAYQATPIARHRLAVRRSLTALPRDTAGDTAATVLTTCYNGAGFIGQYAAAWKRQTNPNFRIVFLDDGSDDGSADLAQKAFDGVEGFTLIRTNRLGRGAALNRALAQVDTDIVLIADVDDIPVPQRVDWTLRAYAADPALQVAGFGIFDLNEPIREQTPFAIAPTSLTARALLGMPMPFPAFSFRKSAMTDPFDEDLKGGIDCEWLFRNCRRTEVKGCFFPTAAVSYAVHDSQISATRNETQKAVKRQAARAYHQSVLGTPGVCDEDGVDLLTAATKLRSRTDKARLDDYATVLTRRILENPGGSAVQSVFGIYRGTMLRMGGWARSGAVGAAAGGAMPRDLRRVRKYKRIARVSVLLNVIAILAALWLALGGA